MRVGNIWALCFSKPQSMRVRLKIWVNDSSEKGKTCVLEPWVSGLWGWLGEASRPHVRLSRTQPEPNAFIFRHEYVCVQSCPTLCDPMDCNQPGSSVHGILQARILFFWQEYWSGMLFPPLGDIPDPWIETWVSCVAGRLLSEPPGKPKV